MSNRHPEEVPAELPGRGRDRHDLHEVCAGLRFNDSRDRHLTATWRDDDGNHAEVCRAQAVSGGAIGVCHGRDDVERKLVAGFSYRERLPSLFHVKLTTTTTTTSGQQKPRGRHSACDPAAVCSRRGCEGRLVSLASRCGGR